VFAEKVLSTGRVSFSPKRSTRKRHGPLDPRRPERPTHCSLHRPVSHGCDTPGTGGSQPRQRRNVTSQLNLLFTCQRSSVPNSSEQSAERGGRFWIVGQKPHSSSGRVRCSVPAPAPSSRPSSTPKSGRWFGQWLDFSHRPGHRWSTSCRFQRVEHRSRSVASVNIRPAIFLFCSARPGYARPPPGVGCGKNRHASAVGK